MDRRVGRRGFLRAVGVAASAALLAACQPQKETVKETVIVEGTPQVIEREVTAVPADEGPTFIRLSVWGHAPDMTTYTNIVQSFMEKQDKIRVSPEQYLGGYYQKAVANFAAGNSADVIYAQGIGWTPFVDNNQLLALDDYIDRDDKASWWPDTEGYNLQCKWEDKIYMSPADAGSIALYYNKDMFDRQGVPYPKDDWTWDDFKALYPKLTYEDQGVQYYAFNDQNSWLWCWAQAWRRDGTLEWDRIVEPTESRWTQPDIIENLQWFGPDARKNGWVPPPSALQGGGISFWEGRVAMCMDGPWYLSWCWGDVSLTEGGLNYGIVEVPKGKTNQSEFCPSVSGHTIYVGTKYKEESWELVKYILDEDGQKAISDGGRMPGVVSMQSSYWTQAVAEKYNCDNPQAFVTAMQQGKPLIIGGEGLDTNSLNAAGSPLGVAFEAMKNGTDAKEALETANPKMQEILDEYHRKKGS